MITHKGSEVGFVENHKEDSAMYTLFHVACLFCFYSEVQNELSSMCGFLIYALSLPWVEL